MHIPDGFLDPAVSITTYAIAIAFTIYAFYRSKREKNNAKPLIPVLAAAIFAAQMLNWPLVGGTSLHFVGGSLSGILLGPWLGYLTMFLVILVQCIVFHDGGITALGANLINMAIIDVLVGYYIFKVFPQKYKKIGAFLGGWAGITLAGIVAGVELGVSSYMPYGISVTLPVMGGWHALLGIIEGVITALVYAYIEKKAPDIISG